MEQSVSSTGWFVVSGMSWVQEISQVPADLRLEP
jgi:hypothetical protein